MKYLEPALACAVVALRLAAIPPSRWGLDWIVVLALFWGALALVPDRPRARWTCYSAAAVWLGVIYALSQGPHTFWLFTR